jgi:8-oxo-dGTP diphosphatase
LAIPRGVLKIVKEITRHVLRRPVVGIAAAARVPDGRWVLVRRTDTGDWALPGGTLEWGEQLRHAIRRELREEAGVDLLELESVSGIYSDPTRDARFHAVTVVVRATVSLPQEPPDNPAEIADVRLFATQELPSALAHGMTDMLRHAAEEGIHLE